MPKPFHLDDTEVIPLDGRSIAMAAPTAPAPPMGYPAVFLLDGDGMFGTMVEALRRSCHRTSATGVEPAVIVGIGSPDRQRDFALPGAGAFLDFIAGEVMPLVAARYKVDPRRRFIFGHSLAGFLVLHALVTRTALFDGYVAASPSIWQDRDHLLRHLPTLATLDTNVRVMTAIGTWEQGLSPWQAGAPDGASMAARRDQRRMVDNARDFAQRLKALDQSRLILRHEELAGEDHASIVPVAIAHGLRFLLAPAALLGDWPSPV